MGPVDTPQFVAPGCTVHGLEDGPMPPKEWPQADASAVVAPLIRAGPISWPRMWATVNAQPFSVPDEARDGQNL